MNAVLIGSRWRPGHVVKRDDELGLFAEINSPIITQTEVATQRALLLKVDDRFTARRIEQARSAQHQSKG